MASTALGDGPSGFSFDASLAMRVEAVLLADGFDGAPRLVRPQRFDIGRDQWHRFYFTGAASSRLYFPRPRQTDSSLWKNDRYF